MNHWSESKCVGGYKPGSAHIPASAWVGAAIFFLVFYVAVPWLGNGAGF